MRGNSVCWERVSETTPRCESLSHLWKESCLLSDRNHFVVPGHQHIKDIYIHIYVYIYMYNQIQSWTSSSSGVKRAECLLIICQIEKFMGLTWGPPGADRTQVGPMLAPSTLLSGICIQSIVGKLWELCGIDACSPNAGDKKLIQYANAQYSCS